MAYVYKPQRKINTAGDTEDILLDVYSVGGYAPSLTSTASTLVVRDATGKIQVNQVEQLASRESSEQTITDVYATYDNVVRKFSKDDFIRILGLLKKEDIVYLDLDLDCDHEYEITGQTGHEYGVAIPETTEMKFVKIQGQTRRYSLNEIRNVKFNNSFSQYGACFIFNPSALKVGQTYTFKCQTKNTGAIVYLNEIIFSPTVTANLYFTCDGTTHLYTVKIIDITNNVLFKNGSDNTDKISADTITDIQLVEGEYTDDTMPPFQPYDNTLVNSKANFISTGKNLYNGNGQNGTTSGFDLIENPLPGNYILTFKATNIGTQYDCRVYYGDTYITLLPSVIGSTNVYVIPVENPGATKIYFNAYGTNYGMSEIMLYYGNYDESISYEPYNSAEVTYGQELGAYDYQDMNNVIHKATSEIITLDGSDMSNWNVNDSGIYGTRFLKNIGKNNGGIIANIPESKEVVPSESTFRFGIYINSIYGYGLCLPTSYNVTTIAELKEWLQKNPIQLVYKKATETIVNHIAPPGYVVYNGGLQEQVIDGKYLPYILTKKYAISLEAQVILNIEMDQIQQEQLDALKQQHNQFEKTTNDSITTINETLDDLESRVSTAEDYLEQISTTYATVTYVDSKVSNLDSTLREYVRTQFGTTEGVTSFKRSQIVEANSSFTLAYGEKCVIVGIAPEDYRVCIEFASRQYYVAPHEVISNFSQYTNVKTGTGISTEYEYGPTYKMYVGSTLVNEFVPVGRKEGTGRTYTNYNIQLTVNVKCIVYFYRLS